MNNFTEFTNFILVGLFFIAATLILVVLWLGILLENAKREIKKCKTRLSFAGIEKDRLNADFKNLQADYALAKSILSEEEILSEHLGDLHARLLVKWWGLREENKKLKAEIAKLSVRPTKRNEKGQFVKSDSGMPISPLKRTAKPEPVPTPKTVRDWTTATKEELLAEAKRRYPAGTKYLDVLDREKFKSKSDPWFYDGQQSNVKVGVCVTDGGGYVYCDGKWAEIIPA